MNTHFKCYLSPLLIRFLSENDCWGNSIHPRFTLTPYLGATRDDSLKREQRRTKARPPSSVLRTHYHARLRWWPIERAKRVESPSNAFWHARCYRTIWGITRSYSRGVSDACQYRIYERHDVCRELTVTCQWRRALWSTYCAHVCRLEGRSVQLRTVASREQIYDNYANTYNPTIRTVICEATDINQESNHC